MLPMEALKKLVKSKVIMQYQRSMSAQTVIHSHFLHILIQLPECSHQLWTITRKKNKKDNVDMFLISIKNNSVTSTAMKTTYIWKINAGVATSYH